MYFDAAGVFVKKTSLLSRFALAILWDMISYDTICRLNTQVLDNLIFLIRNASDHLKTKVDTKNEQSAIFLWVDSYVQLNKYETAPNFIQLSQNLTSDCFYQFLHDVITKLFFFDCRTIL